MKLYNVETKHSDNSVAYCEGLSLQDVLALVSTLDKFDAPVVTIVEQL